MKLVFAIGRGARLLKCPNPVPDHFMKVIYLVPVITFAFLTGACEKQSYSETRAFTHHGGHGGHSGGTHEGEGEAGAAHDKPAGEKAAGEKPAAH